MSLIFIVHKTHAQTSSSIGQPGSYENIVAYYKDKIGADANLYTGKEYPAYKSGIQGTPFFNSASMQKAEIFYDGNLYKDVPLLYDLVRQEVIINRYDDNTRIKLLNEKIKYFIIEGHLFENIFVSEGIELETGSRFYDVAFDGGADILISRVKKIEMTLDPQVPPKFTERDKYFIRNRNNLYGVSKTSLVVKAFNDKKDQVRIFIRKNKFRFKQNIEEELVKTAAYYETLIK